MTRPLLCLVTDRQRLSRELATARVEPAALLLRQIEGAVKGEIDLVQIRENDLDTRTLARVVREAVALASGSKTRIVVNERVDVALAANAGGVHLREASAETAAVRRIARRLCIGRSVHSVEGVRRSGDVDYLIAGTTFSSPSKPDASAHLGEEGLRQIVMAAGAVPVLAIGGVTESTAARLGRAGAAGLAGIGAFLPSAEASDVAAEVAEIARRLRFVFDTASAIT